MCEVFIYPWELTFLNEHLFFIENVFCQTVHLGSLRHKEASSLHKTPAWLTLGVLISQSWWFFLVRQSHCLLLVLWSIQLRNKLFLCLISLWTSTTGDLVWWFVFYGNVLAFICFCLATEEPLWISSNWFGGLKEASASLPFPWGMSWSVEDVGFLFSVFSGFLGSLL